MGTRSMIKWGWEQPRRASSWPLNDPTFFRSSTMSFVGALFLGSRKDVEREYWDLWRAELRGESGEELRDAVESVRSQADYDGSTSVLRVIDIVVWSLNR